MALWIRTLFLLGCLVSLRAWACASGGCSKPSEFGGNTQSSSIQTSTTPPPQIGFTGGDAGTNVPEIPQASGPAPLAPVAKYDPKRGSIDFDSLAASSREFRAVEKRSLQGQGKPASPAAHQRYNAIANGDSAGLVRDDVIQPASVRAARATGSNLRLPRTIASE